MLASQLGVLVLSSICSGMLLRNTTLSLSSSEEEEGSTPDPNTFRWPRADGSGQPPEDQRTWSPLARSRPVNMPPAGQQGPPSGNQTDGSDSLRMMVPDSLMPPMSDPAICDMLFNAPIPPPVDAIPFFCICSRCKGTVGPKGDRGDRGLPGIPGSPGRRGMTGFKGYRGFTGPQGIKGQKGDAGEKGQLGMIGFTGMKGQRGFKGEKGDQGSMGPAGSQGPQGETGTCPASCESVPGAHGPQGAPGSVGARGLPGVQGSVGSKGIKGDTGDLGLPGDPGLTGEKGDQGEQGICECTDGADGTDGRPGERGSKGDKGDTGAEGSQGLVGSRGSQGDMGLMGPPGPCSPAIQSAFSACLNQSFPKKDWPVSFPDVLNNRQGHYDPLMGTYTAPVNGTYVFSFHLATAERPLKVGIFRNFYPIIKATETSTQATTSQTIVLHLEMDDRIWLQVKDYTTNGMFSGSESTSTFSGYLLHPDSCDVPINRHHHLVMKSPPTGGFGWDGPQVNATHAPN
ncbi:otolin-1-like [Cololabis saira]|uniref:otolin-1-like n=1 Tax=Cololabis saira TaxID=129043 RepID=UPI002AD39975|nr:otolin-1-like [Cololabis saira]